MAKETTTQRSKGSTETATPKKSGLQAVKKAKSEKTEKTKTKRRKGRFSGPSPPYKLKNAEYRELLTPLQIELLKVQRWVKEEKEKIVIICEGRDAAGKGGAIKCFTEHLNPRGARMVALNKPNETERHQWYFQRYVSQMPTGGEIVFFDRSWYNRAGVEVVMGFCTPKEYLEFMRQVPEFELMLVNSGIRLFKLWFEVSREEQRRRFRLRRTDRLKQWKLSPIDLASISKWDLYTQAQHRLFFYTNTEHAPWMIIRSDDKKRARINALRHVIRNLPYPKKDRKVGKVDPRIVVRVSDVFDPNNLEIYGVPAGKHFLTDSKP